MSFIPPKPCRIPRSRSLYFRMRVPTDLLEVYAPRTEWKFSLHTEDDKEAQSKILLKAQQLEQEFSEHRRKLKAKPQPLETSPAIPEPAQEEAPALTPFTQISALELERLALLYPHEALHKDEANRRAPLRKDVKEAKAAWDEQQALLVELNAAKGIIYTPKPFRRLSGISEEEGRQLERDAELFVAASEPFIAEGDTHIIESVADSYLAEHGIATPETEDERLTSEAYRKFCLDMLLQEVTVQKAVLQRSKGAWIETPEKPKAGKMTNDMAQAKNAAHLPQNAPGVGVNPNLIPSIDNPPFSEAWKRYLEERKPSPGTLRSFEASVRRFIELVGDLPIKAITKTHILQYKDVLVTLPTNLPRSMDRKKFPEVLKWVDEQIAKGIKFKVLAPKTTNEGRLAVLSTVFTTAIRNGYINFNPASGITVYEQKTKTRVPVKNPYSQQDIETIFKKSSLFSQCSTLGTLPKAQPATTRRGKRYPAWMAEAVRTDYRWLLLLGMYTGARIEELSHLQLGDVLQRQGISCLSIYANEDGTRTIKTATAQRLIPVHPRLLELGFLSHVQKLKSQHGEQGQLFPTFIPNAQNKMSDKFTDWWKKYSEELGIRQSIEEGRLGAAKPKSFHSFRRLFKNMGMNSGVSQEHLDEIQGHADNSVSSGYALDENGMRFNQRVLFEAIGKMQFLNVTAGIETLFNIQKQTVMI